jgi:phosphatidylserine decarboxylase
MAAEQMDCDLVNLTAIRERVAVDAIKWAPKSMFSGIVGWGARRKLPRSLRAPIYQAFANAVGAELGEVECELSEYGSLGAFFARGLKPGARVLPADEQLWAAPCDCFVAEAGLLRGRAIEAKGRSFSIPALLSSERLALALEDGEFVTLYLSPKDYHRVHAPIDCQLVGYQYIPGSLYPVGPFCLDHIDNIFSMNERLVLEFECREGIFAMVMVGAAGVGNLCLSQPELQSRFLRHSATRQAVRLETPISMRRGEEVGAFELGSTVILCAPPRTVELSACIGDSLRFGDAIASPSKSRGRA